MSQSVLFPMWKSVFEHVDLDPGLGRMAARDSNLGREPSRTTKPLVSLPETVGPNSIAVGATGKFELGPRPVATSKLSVPNGAGEARAPSVISSIDRRARVGSAGMNPLPRVREAHRFKVVLR